MEGVQLVSLDSQNLTALGSGVFRIDVPVYEPPLEATVGLSAAAEPLSGKAQLLVVSCIDPMLKFYFPPQRNFVDQSFWAKAVTNNGGSLDAWGSYHCDAAGYMSLAHSEDWNPNYEPFQIGFKVYIQAMTDCTLVSHNVHNTSLGAVS